MVLILGSVVWGASSLCTVSCEAHTTHFMELSDGKNLIQKTYQRAAKLPQVYKENGKAKIPTVANRDYNFMSCNELKKATVKLGWHAKTMIDQVIAKMAAGVY